MVVPCAQLRVFVPVDTLDGRDAERWSGDVGALGHAEARTVEEQVGRSRLLTGRGGLTDRAVLVRRSGDERFVCPLQLDVRAAAGLRQLRDAVPAPVLDLLVDAPLRSHLDRVSALGRAPTIVDAPWVVPVAWFVLFDDDERRFLDPSEGAGPRLLYLTTAAQALDRLERAVLAVDDAIEDADELLEELADVADWLQGFDPRSLVELDYAGLTRVIDAPRLERDRSAHDVWCAIEGLESGDLLAAVAYYGALRSRWGPLRSQVTAS